MYTAENLYGEFPTRISYENSKFLRILNTYYDKVLVLPINDVKSLLPINFVGEGGSYLEPWMIRKLSSGRLKGQIYNWKGDKSTSDVVTMLADSEEDLYRKLLIGYMDYLDTSGEEFSKIVEKLND